MARLRLIYETTQRPPAPVVAAAAAVLVTSFFTADALPSQKHYAPPVEAVGPVFVPVAQAPSTSPDRYAQVEPPAQRRAQPRRDDVAGPVFVPPVLVWDQQAQRTIYKALLHRPEIQGPVFVPTVQVATPTVATWDSTVRPPSPRQIWRSVDTAAPVFVPASQIAAPSVAAWDAPAFAPRVLRFSVRAEDSSPFLQPIYPDRYWLDQARVLLRAGRAQRSEDAGPVFVTPSVLITTWWEQGTRPMFAASVRRDEVAAPALANIAVITVSPLRLASVAITFTHSMAISESAADAMAISATPAHAITFTASTADLVKSISEAPSHTLKITTGSLLP